MKRLKNLVERPSAKDLLALGDAWRPFRGAGALMLWHLYGILVRKVTIDEEGERIIKNQLRKKM